MAKRVLKKKSSPKIKSKLKKKPAASQKTKPAVKAAGTGLKAGAKAPDFKLLADDGRLLTLSAFKGKKIVLYFYPKDDTPGCTKESCSFRDAAKEIEKLGAAVLGASVDSVESHQKFKTKYRLNFPLLSDSEKKLVNAYGIWKQKSLYGRTYMGTERTTVIIDENGRIAKVFPQVKVDAHLDEVLESLRSMSGELNLMYR